MDTDINRLNPGRTRLGLCRVKAVALTAWMACNLTMAHAASVAREDNKWIVENRKLRVSVMPAAR